MCLYLFNNAHTGITTSDLKNSENIIDQLKCCINVTKRLGAFMNHWKFGTATGQNKIYIWSIIIY